MNSPAQQQQLIVSCQGLVRSIAWKIRCKLPKHVDLEDLVSYGQLGLAEAAPQGYRQRFSNRLHNVERWSNELEPARRLRTLGNRPSNAHHRFEPNARHDVRRRNDLHYPRPVADDDKRDA